MENTLLAPNLKALLEVLATQTPLVASELEKEIILYGKGIHKETRHAACSVNLTHISSSQECDRANQTIMNLQFKDSVKNG